MLGSIPTDRLCALISKQLAANDGVMFAQFLWRLSWFIRVSLQVSWFQLCFRQCEYLLFPKVLEECKSSTLLTNKIKEEKKLYFKGIYDNICIDIDKIVFLYKIYD